LNSPSVSSPINTVRRQKKAVSISWDSSQWARCGKASSSEEMESGKRDICESDHLQVE